jgi:hypothetical protein
VTSIPTIASVTVNALNLTAGSYEMVVQGTSSTTTHTLLISFNVGDFQISGPQSVTLEPGTQGPADLTVTASAYYRGGINATCTVNSLPGSTCTVTPPNPIVVSKGSTVPLVATISVPNNAVPGAYNVNITAQDTTGNPSHNTNFSLTVEQDFQVSSSTPSQTVAAGGTSGAYNLLVQPVGAFFNSAVTLACGGGLPAGAQCLFNPSTAVTPGSTSAPVSMSISTGATTGVGTASVIVTGTSGSLSHSVSVALIVTNAITNSGDFQLAVTQPFPAGVAAGVQAQARVSVTSNYSGSINASCDASAISGQCVIAPLNPIAINASAPASLTISVNLPNTISPATYNINLMATDSSGQPSHTLTLPLTVIQDFAVTSATPSQTLQAGQSGGAYQLTVAPNPFGSSFAGTVSLSCPAGLPSGAQCLFAPSAIVTLGSGPTAVVMSISTSGRALHSSTGRVFLYALWLLLPGIVVGCSAGRIRSSKPKPRVLGLSAMLILLTLSLLSCGGVSNGSTTTTGNKPVTYQITVTGTSPGTTPDPGQSTVVTLVVD